MSKFRISTNKFSYVIERDTFMQAVEKAARMAQEQNLIIMGVFEIDPVSMRRKLATYEEKRWQLKSSNGSMEANT